MTDSCSFPSVDSETTSLVNRSRTTHLPVPVRGRERFIMGEEIEWNGIESLFNSTLGKFGKIY